MTSSEDAKEIDYEQLLLKLPDCFVFKVPPLRSASGHRAEDWELEKPLFVGYLKIYQVSLYYLIANILHTICFMLLYTQTGGYQVICKNIYDKRCIFTFTR